MKYLKTYENILSDTIIKLDYRIKNYSWNNSYETNDLLNFGFYRDEFRFIYDINLSNTKVIITKIAKQLPGMEGFKTRVKANIIKNGKKQTKYFVDGSDVIKYVDSIIPETEKDANKYNL